MLEFPVAQFSLLNNSLVHPPLRAPRAPTTTFSEILKRSVPPPTTLQIQVSSTLRESVANAAILYSGLKRLPKLFEGQSLGRGRGGLASDPTSPPTIRVGSCLDKSKGFREGLCRRGCKPAGSESGRGT